ncbi:Molybdopterin synthase catalytic subunit [Posidoniimonas polymericola]|uniref:Molybdopterin synthase catalytic subunit n=1 Tax=Posidoniimonas polymericola TaxID=2528002 RepID=A0A5C5XWE1_9BACT|nr:molybdenum cofactor biosynthesis protein MoaE [Posidoniimonas polymericola]TWT67657.1 Molybdopterin synthase catalytic subunit [Posidoniimonas polymericola]
MIQITHDLIDLAPMIARAQVPAAGAVVTFLGITREFTGDRQTVELVYEAYAEMAQRELERLEREARGRWPLEECCITHRLGLTPLSEASVAVVVSSAHRPEAFEAARWLIDELKRSVPIWKQERWSDGATEWVHPAPVSEGDAP